MSSNEKPKIRFIDFSKEPLGWPPDENEVLIDINSIGFSNMLPSLSNDSSENLEMEILKLTENPISLSASSSNPDFTLSGLEALFGVDPPGLANTSASVPEIITSLPSSSSSLTIRVENPDGDQIFPDIDRSSDSGPEPSNKRRKLTHQPPSELPHDAHHLSSGVISCSQQLPSIPAGDSNSLFSSSIVNMNDTSSDELETAINDFTISAAAVPRTTSSFDASLNSLLQQHIPFPGSEYVSGNISSYSDNYHAQEFQDSNMDVLLGFPLSQNLNYCQPNLFRTSTTLPSSFNEFTHNVPNGNSTPILDLQIQPDIPYDSSSSFPNDAETSAIDPSSNKQFVDHHPRVIAQAQTATNVMEGFSPTPPLTQPISRSSRLQKRPQAPSFNNEMFVYNHVPLIPTLVHPIAPDQVHSNSPSQSSMDRNLGSLSETEGTYHSGGSTETYRPPRPIIPIQVSTPIEQPVAAVDKTRQKKSSPKGRIPRKPEQSKKFYFRPICPSKTQPTPTVTSPSPSSSNSPSGSPSNLVDLTGTDDSSSQTTGTPTHSIIELTPNGNEEKYLVNIPFNTIIPTSEAEVTRRMTGVAFLDLKQYSFGFGPISEILDDPNSRPFLDFDRMTELYVLVKWPFPLGLNENNHEHKIIKLDRSCNHIRRVEILCKIARKLSDYIQKEETIPFDLKKLRILELRQRSDKKWIVKIGFNNSRN